MPLTGAEKVAAFRERARAAGLCGVCGQRPPRAGLVTCEECNDAAKARVKASRS